MTPEQYVERALHPSQCCPQISLLPLFVYLCICVFVYLCFCVLIYLCFLCIHVLVYLCICVFVYFVFVYLCICIFQAMCTNIFPSVSALPSALFASTIRTNNQLNSLHYLLIHQEYCKLEFIKLVLIVKSCAGPA